MIWLAWVMLFTGVVSFLIVAYAPTKEDEADRETSGGSTGAGAMEGGSMVMDALAGFF